MTVRSEKIEVCEQKFSATTTVKKPEPGWLPNRVLTRQPRCAPGVSKTGPAYSHSHETVEFGSAERAETVSASLEETISVSEGA